MTDRLARLTEALLTAARQPGADAAHALAVDGSSISLDVRGASLVHAERAEGIPTDPRPPVAQRQACASASDLSSRTLSQMA